MVCDAIQGLVIGQWVWSVAVLIHFSHRERGTASRYMGLHHLLDVLLRYGVLEH
jgi:hypothetical protein